MNRKAAKAIVIFLVAMLAFTFLSWKLDGLRTPQVLCVSPGRGQVGGTSYDQVIPAAALYDNGSYYYVYVVEESGSYFHPVVAQRTSVRLVDSDGAYAAVQISREDPSVVWISERELTESAVPVRVWEEEQP